MSRTNRLCWISNTRGLMMVFVVCFHASQQYGTPWLLNTIESLVLPLFFFLSGMMLQVNLTSSEFLKLKTRSILKPYFGFAALFFGIYVAHKIINPGFMGGSNPLQFFFGIFYASTLPGWTLSVSLWFLPCLFVMQCLIFYGLKLPKKWFYTAVVALTMLGCYVNSFHLPLPWSVDRACSDLIYAVAGLALAKTLTRRTFIIKAPVVAVLTAGWVACSWMMLNVSMYAPVWMVVKYASGLLAILSMIGLFQRVPKISYLSTIGRETLPVLGLHPIAFMVITMLLRRILHLPVISASQDLTGLLPPLEIFAVMSFYMVGGLTLPLAAAHYYRKLQAATRPVLAPVRSIATRKVLSDMAYSLRRMASL